MASLSKKSNYPLKRIMNINGMGSVLPLLIIIVLLSIFTDSFLSATNILQVLRQSAVYAAMATGMTFVIITGGIDLSVGSILAFSCSLSAFAINNTGSAILAILISLLSGAAVGLFNGIIVAFVKIPAFIMTLGSMYIFRGSVMYITGSKSVSIKNAVYKFIGQESLLGIPTPIVVFIFVGIIAIIILRYTSFGRYIYAIGSNIETARLSGVRVERTIVLTYVISGIMVGLAAVIYLGRLGTAQPTAGVGYEMEAIAAVIIGGTSIAGGSGGIFGTMIGAVMVSVIRNGLVLIGVQSYGTQIVIGIVLVCVVSLDITRKRLSANK